MNKPETKDVYFKGKNKMKVSKPKVTNLASGEIYMTKRMEGNTGEFLPKHEASAESVLVVTDGACYFHIDDQKHHLKSGDTFVIPEKAIHQVEVIQDLKAIHIMPKDIKFKFFN